MILILIENTIFTDMCPIPVPIEPNLNQILFSSTLKNWIKLPAAKAIVFGSTTQRLKYFRQSYAYE